MIRFIHICFVLIKYGFLLLLLKIGVYKKPPGSFIRRLFEDAGGSFIKFGQLLALRTDVLPKEYSLAMIDLLDNVAPFPYHKVQERFLQELGTKPEKLFLDFQREPFASGSYGQVHAAKLEDGTIVAVKIMRPGIDEMVQADFFIINIVTTIAQIFLKISGFNWKEFAIEFKKWTLLELDYQTEAENAERLKRNIGPDRLIVIPRIYDRLSTKRILVQDYIDGFPLTRVLRGLKEHRITREELFEMGIDLSKTPRTLTYEILHQLFFDGFFHADLHPGNIILMQNDQIGLIDFGIMGEWMSPNQTSFIRFAKNVGDHNFKEMTYYFCDVVSDDLKQMIQSAFPANMEKQRVDDFIHILTNHLAQTVEEISVSSLKDIKEMKTDQTVLFMKLVGAGENYKLKLPQDMVIFLKAFSTLGLVAKEMDFSFSLTEEFKQFFKTHPEETIPVTPKTKPSLRMSRERAMEQLNNWLSYLMEARPDIYKLVQSSIMKYNTTDT